LLDSIPSNPNTMAQYSLLLNKKGTILSISAINVDPKRFPVQKMTGRHFSRLIGSDCKKDLRHIMQETLKTRQPGSFRTFLAARGAQDGLVLEWTIQPKSGSIFFPARYVLVGRDPE
jgi:hypothetical protein